MVGGLGETEWSVDLLQHIVLVQYIMYFDHISPLYLFILFLLPQNPSSYSNIPFLSPCLFCSLLHLILIAWAQVDKGNLIVTIPPRDRILSSPAAINCLLFFRGSWGLVRPSPVYGGMMVVPQLSATTVCSWGQWCCHIWNTLFHSTPSWNTDGNILSRTGIFV